MANTIIQLRHSTIQGNVPVSLANGEISINTRDGKLFYSKPDGTIMEFSGFAGPSGLNREVQFNDSGTLGANGQFTFNKSLPALNVGGVSLTNTYIQFGDGTRQYTANVSTYTYTASASAPASPDPGDHWYSTVNDVLYEYINDGTSNYWVDITSSAVSVSETAEVFNPFLLSGM